MNEFDDKYNRFQKIKRIPLISMREKRLNIRIKELEIEFLKNKESNIGAEFSCFQKFLAKQRVSSYIRGVMVLTFIASFMFFKFNLT